MADSIGIWLDAPYTLLMVKNFIFGTLVVCLCACTDTEQQDASKTQSNDNSIAVKIDDAPIEPVTSKAKNSANTESVNATNLSSIDGSFAAPDSKNNALFDDIISAIVAGKTRIDFSKAVNPQESLLVTQTCKKIDKKLASVTLNECLSSNLRPSTFVSNKGTPILVTEFPPVDTRTPMGKILIIGGTHGDELTSISIVFKWIKILQKYHSGLFHWHIAPLMNPDGALLPKATRPNSKNVDLNRNMPTPDWHRLSSERWKKIGKDPRKSPGNEPASEPETQWLIHEIETFQPDAIVSVHAPYGILDFDSPDLTNAPKHFGRLRLNLLGTYPGSLGNYAGINRDIPVLTLELPHSWVMPKDYEINEIWTDMIGWLKIQLAHN